MLSIGHDMAVALRHTVAVIPLHKIGIRSSQSKF